MSAHKLSFPAATQRRINAAHERRQQAATLPPQRHGQSQMAAPPANVHKVWVGDRLVGDLPLSTFPTLKEPADIHLDAEVDLDSARVVINFVKGTFQFIGMPKTFHKRISTVKVARVLGVPKAAQNVFNGLYAYLKNNMPTDEEMTLIEALAEESQDEDSQDTLIRCTANTLAYWEHKGYLKNVEAHHEMMMKHPKLTAAYQPILASLLSRKQKWGEEQAARKEYRQEAMAFKQEQCAERRVENDAYYEQVRKNREEQDERARIKASLGKKTSSKICVITEEEARLLRRH